MFKLECEQDLEGLVCKHLLAPYGPESAPGIKVLDPAYSQCERHELRQHEHATGTIGTEMVTRRTWPDY